MQKALVQQYRFPREELRDRLLGFLQEMGVKVRGEIRLILDDSGALIEETMPDERPGALWQQNKKGDSRASAHE